MNQDRARYNAAMCNEHHFEQTLDTKFFLQCLDMPKSFNPFCLVAGWGEYNWMGKT